MRPVSLLQPNIWEVHISYQDTKIPYISAKTPTATEDDLWSMIMIQLYEMDSNFFLSLFAFHIITVELCCQPKISNFGQHLFQLPPVQRPKVVVTAVDGSVSGWISFVLHGQGRLLLDKISENIVILKGH